MDPLDMLMMKLVNIFGKIAPIVNINFNVKVFNVGCNISCKTISYCYFWWCWMLNVFGFHFGTIIFILYGM